MLKLESCYQASLNEGFFLKFELWTWIRTFFLPVIYPHLQVSDVTYKPGGRPSPPTTPIGSLTRPANLVRIFLVPAICVDMKCTFSSCMWGSDKDSASLSEMALPFCTMQRPLIYCYTQHDWWWLGGGILYFILMKPSFVVLGICKSISTENALVNDFFKILISQGTWPQCHRSQ